MKDWKNWKNWKQWNWGLMVTVFLCLIFYICLLSGCVSAKHGEWEYVRIGNQDVQGFLMEGPDGTHIEFEKQVADNTEAMKALAQANKAIIEAWLILLGLTP